MTDSYDQLVNVAEIHYRAAVNSDGRPDSPEVARRLRVLETARRWRDMGGTDIPGASDFDPVKAYLTILDKPAPVVVPQSPTYPADPVDWHTLLSGDDDDEQYLLEPLLVAGRSHALYAPAKTGKSLLVLDAVIALATGTPFLDQPASDPVDVVYLDYEMTRSDLRSRVAAMERSAGDLDRLHYYLIPPLDTLDTPAGGQQVERLVNRHNARLVIIDTTARAIAGDENEANVIQDLYRYTGMRLKSQGVAVLRVDHAGKNLERGQRGSSAKNDDVDVVWQLTGNGGDRLTLKCTHQRLGYLPDQIALVRTEQPLGHRFAVDQWPAGTAELAERLDALGLADDTGRPAVMSAVAAWNQEHPDARLEATKRQVETAIRYRRSGLRRRPLEAMIEGRAA